jgi:hypothetical protein
MARRLALGVLVLAAGLAYSLLLMGPRPLDPADLDWLKGDPLEHYLGWLFFTQTPGWSFPLTWSDRLGYPVGGYLSLIDPALPLTFGLLRGLLPGDHQYFGLFFAINAALQLFWGTLLTGRLSGGNRFAAAIGGLFFLASPIMAQKALGHFSGGCHWPILAGLFFLLGERATMAPLMALTAFSAAIHPYLAATLCLIAWAAVLRRAADACVGPVRGAFEFAACPAVLAAALYAVGILSVGAGAAAEGFQDYSLNVLGLINPTPYPSLLPLRMAVFPLQEYEGYAYLGLGVLGLLAALILRRPRFGWSRGTRLALAALVAGCLVAALSNRVTFGRHVLFEYPVPPPLVFVTAAFRAPARFIWPAYYLITGLAVAGVARAWPARGARILLLAAVVLQFFDLAGLRATVRQFHGTPSDDPEVMHEWSTAWPGPSEVWRRIGRGHAHLAVLPAWQCGSGTTPGGERGYAIFGRLAATLGLTLNEYRASRYAPASLAAHCQTIPGDVARGELRSDTAYVLNDYLFLRLMAAGGARAHACSRVDGYTLCLADADAPRTDWRSVVPPIRPDQAIRFDRAGSGAGLLSADWQRPESWGVWSRAADAALILPLSGPGAVDLALTLRPLLAESRPLQEVRLSTRGIPLARWSLAPDAEQNPRRIHIPPDLVPPSGLLELTLSVDELATPRQLGYPGDDRRLGVGLVSIAVEGQ